MTVTSTTLATLQPLAPYVSVTTNQQEQVQDLLSQAPFRLVIQPPVDRLQLYLTFSLAFFHGGTWLTQSISVEISDVKEWLYRFNELYSNVYMVWVELGKPMEPYSGTTVWSNAS